MLSRPATIGFFLLGLGIFAWFFLGPPQMLDFGRPNSPDGGMLSLLVIYGLFFLAQLFGDLPSRFGYRGPPRNEMYSSASPAWLAGLNIFRVVTILLLAAGFIWQRQLADAWQASSMHAVNGAGAEWFPIIWSIAPLAIFAVVDRFMWSSLRRQYEQDQGFAPIQLDAAAKAAQVEEWDREMVAQGYPEGKDEHYI